MIVSIMNSGLGGGVGIWLLFRLVLLRMLDWFW